MSLVPQPWPEPAPQLVEAVAAMYRGKRERPLPVLVRDKLGEWLSDEQFVGAYGMRGKPGWPPSRLALVTIFQKAENLTDRQAAECVRTRIDWKYALGLDLADPGFDHSVLSEFRSRVTAGGLDQVVLDTLLERLAEHGLVGAGATMRTDSTHVISAVRDLNRLELAGESVRACLEQLVVAAPQVVAQLLDDSWGTRYAARVDTWRIPATAARQHELALAYGRDGHTLLTAVYAAAASDPDLAFLAGLRQVEVLRVVLVQNYLTVTGEQGREVITRREAEVEGLPPGRSRIASPYDTDTRWGAKRDTFWNGYKVHVTETCDTAGPAHDSDGEGDGDDATAAPPHLIVNVETTDATVPDNQMTEPIHAHLGQRGLLPGEHLLDSGYPSAELLVSSQTDYGITLITPILADTSPQARAGAGFDRTAFAIDFDAQHATCPQGHTSSSWNPVTQRGTPTIVITFSKAGCGPCPVRELCTTSASQRRQLTVHTREVHQAQLTARAAADTKDFQARYALRAGVEGTIRQGVAITGMRRARYRGLDKTRTEHTYAAVALNLIRLSAWWNGHPLDRTRTSHLACLQLKQAS
ncbi:MAG TPA: IS1182 family transposase [Xanthobacteraceae bacterium]|nr:IS1182 family transposase [Xanthobacteraceae bacterium]